jgi:hypothetical protein
LIIYSFQKYSLNVTNVNSVGFVRRDDPIYTSLPPDSRKPPAPIDPSGKAFNQSCLLFILLILYYSFQMVLHLLSSGVNVTDKAKSKNFAHVEFHVEFKNTNLEYINVLNMQVIYKSNSESIKWTSLLISRSMFFYGKIWLSLRVATITIGYRRYSPCSCMHRSCENNKN